MPAHTSIRFIGLAGNPPAPFDDEWVALTYGKQRGPDFAKFSEQQIFHQWYPDLSKLDQETAFCNNANAAIRKVYGRRTPTMKRWPGWRIWPGPSVLRNRDMRLPMWPRRKWCMCIRKRRAVCLTVIAVKPWPSNASIRGTFQFIWISRAWLPRISWATCIMRPRTPSVGKALPRSLVPLHAVSWDAPGLPRVGPDHAATARDVLLCRQRNQKISSKRDVEPIRYNKWVRKVKTEPYLAYSNLHYCSCSCFCPNTFAVAELINW